MNGFERAKTIAYRDMFILCGRLYSADWDRAALEGLRDAMGIDPLEHECFADGLAVADVGQLDWSVLRAEERLP